MTYAVITTFANAHFEIYAKSMLESFAKLWPAEIPLLVQLDDDLLADQVGRILRPQDAIAVGWTQEHKDFVSRNKDKDDPKDYRRQVTRFSHKVFAVHRAYEAIKKQKAEGGNAPRYLIWMDADVITNKPVSISDIQECLPRDGAVSYLGRKDWPHSECGWLAFDLDNEGDVFIDVWHGLYVSDAVLKLDQTHDSWAFDHIRKSEGSPKVTNLTEGKPGMDIWPHSPMGKWSTHYKGPVAKQNLVEKPMQQSMQSGLKIQTKNSIPDEKIREQIAANQALIKNWVRECTKTDEQIVVVSAGPQLIAEDVLDDYNNGKKIVAVKHALDPLKKAGITPWACILLDPRPHVYDFVQDADPNVLWFVASQVDPRVTTKLLAHGCTVWGYHASVGAGEGDLTIKQSDAIISGGSATATRGLFLLKHLGFSKIKLYGYDLCFPDKPDLNAVDEHKQPKHLEISIGWNHPLSNVKKCFWTEPQLVAQFEEINQLITAGTFELEAVGDGIIPFVLKSKRAGELRQAKLKATMGVSKPSTYGKLLKWNRKKKTNSLTMRLSSLLNSLPRVMKLKP